MKNLVEQNMNNISGEITDLNCSNETITQTLANLSECYNYLHSTVKFKTPVTLGPSIYKVSLK